MMDTSVQKRLKVLLIGDRDSEKQALQEQFKGLPCDLTGASWLSEGMDQLSEGGYDAILLNLEMQVGKGLRTFELMKKYAGDCPIIVLADHEEDQAALGALRAGAHYCLTRDQLTTYRMTQAVRFAVERNHFEVMRNQTIKSLEEQAIYDPLTGLFNGKYFEQAAKMEIHRAERTGAPFAVVLVDVDRLRSFNESYGREVGDKLLAETGRYIQSQVRKYDTICRFGGDEFVLLMPGISAEDAVLRAEKIRHGTGLHLGGGAEFSLTVSLGIASYPRHGKTVNGLLQTAVDAVFTAKEGGRNRVVLAPTGDAPSARFENN